MAQTDILRGPESSGVRPMEEWPSRVGSDRVWSSQEVNKMVSEALTKVPAAGKR